MGKARMDEDDAFLGRSGERRSRVKRRAKRTPRRGRAEREGGGAEARRTEVFAATLPYCSRPLCRFFLFRPSKSIVRPKRRRSSA